MLNTIINRVERKCSGAQCVYTSGGVDGGQKSSLGVPAEVSGPVSSIVPHVVHHHCQVLQGCWRVGGERLQSHRLQEREGESTITNQPHSKSSSVFISTSPSFPTLSLSLIT